MLTQSISTYWSQLKDYIFIFRLIIFYAIWKCAYFLIWRIDWLFDIYNNFVWWFIYSIIDLTQLSLNLLVFNELRVNYDERLIAIENSGGVDIGEPCIGFGVFFTFIALIISWKGFQKKQLWFIPLGLFILHILNIARVTILCFISYHDRSLLEFNHDFTFKIIIYSAIAALWFWWLKIVDKQSST